MFERSSPLGRRRGDVSRTVSKFAHSRSPKALLSDFGTSEEMLRGRRERTGHTGTMEYMVRTLINTSINTRHLRPS